MKHAYLRGSLALVISLGYLLSIVAAGPVSASIQSSNAVHYSRSARPVLAFYYTWYHPSTFSRRTMSDLPVTPYDSSDVSTIDRQIQEAWDAGITGFITSWPGPGNTQNDNLALLYNRIAPFDQQPHHHFVSSVYFETDAAAIHNNLAGAMAYLMQHYTRNPYFFRWQGRPVILLWDPLGSGRRLATWAAVRERVDPGHTLLWSAEGTSMDLLSVFDGIHLFSAAYWGLLDGTISSVDRHFRAEISSYNAAHHTQKIWAAGVEPGYDDTRVPGRAGTYRVPRKDGATYRMSWQAAINSAPSWITITTFNEWFEGAMIEPSRTYGNLYLRLTKQFSRGWRAG